MGIYLLFPSPITYPWATVFHMRNLLKLVNLQYIELILKLEKKTISDFDFIWNEWKQTRWRWVYSRKFCWQETGGRYQDRMFSKRFNSENIMSKLRKQFIPLSVNWLLHKFSGGEKSTRKIPLEFIYFPKNYICWKSCRAAPLLTLAKCSQLL